MQWVAALHAYTSDTSSKLLLDTCARYVHCQCMSVQVDILFKQHQNMLKVLYSRYRLKPSGGGLRPKVLKLDGWLALMGVSAHLE